MRVLIVAEMPLVVDSLQRIFSSQPGYETFAYTILLKALDNIEEIKPDIVCISAVDYPRHWKLFVRYLRSPLFIPAPAIVLLTDKKFDADEHQKANALDIKKCIDVSILEQCDSVDSLLRGSTNPAIPTSSTLSERVQCVFMHQKTGKLVSGTVIACGGNIFTFAPNTPVSNFEPGEIIESCFLKINDKLQNATIQVIAADSMLKLKVLKIC
jgi:DNA-binding NarL/FixJ family response regulator